MTHASYWDRRRAWLWTLLFAGNLVVPFPLGLMAAGPGWPGIVVAVAAIWAGGLVVCARMDRFGPVMLRGAAGLMLAQFAPVLQILAGCLAWDSWERVAGPRPIHDDFGPDLDLTGGFVVTVLTAVPLLTAAFALGALYHWLFEPAAADEVEES